MIIYRPWSAEGYQWVLLADKDGYTPIWNTLRVDPGRPAQGRWVPPRVRLLTEWQNERYRHADLPWYSGYVMAVTHRARTVLEDIVADDAEFLPLECEEEDLWLMHPWRSVFAFDATKSDFRLLPSGRINEVIRYAFLEESIRELTCFTDQRLPARLFVTDAVVTAINNAGLTGMSFQQVWKSSLRSV